MTVPTPMSFVWLWLTHRCQLACTMCYAESSPAGTHGSMTRNDWITVIDEVSEMDVRVVKFIGGEPTLHPDLTTLAQYALGRGLEVEILTNLVHVTEELWSLFQQPGVSLSTSYFSDDPVQHDTVTGRPSHRRTHANLAEALRREIPVRAGVIEVGDGQRVEQAHEELVALGVPAIGYDRVRRVGRGGRGRRADVGQLCGRCGDGVASIGPDGEVRVCVFAGGTPPIGDVRTTPLATLAGRLAAARRYLVAAGMPDRTEGECDPAASGANCFPHNR